MSTQKVDVVNKILDLEKRGAFDVDVFVDPETIPLKEGEVDYKYNKLSTKMAANVANFIAKRYINGLIRKHQLIIKEVKGIENYRKIKNEGALITCNHFHPFDNFAVYKALEKELKKEKLFKVIREGNYTNFPGLYGYFFKHCNTLPLSSNTNVMKECLEGIKYHLSKKRKILIYPEQALWPNYKKPRPLKDGVFSIAANNNSPILPIFITFFDSSYKDNNGDSIQELTIHILKPVLPNEELSLRENINYLKNEVYRQMKEKYEEVYNAPLTYGN